MSSISRAALIAALLSPAAAYAQTATPDAPSDIVVTATRGDQASDRDLLGSSITVITANDMALRQTQEVSDVLRDVPGVEVSRTGAVGDLTDVRIRGAESNHTLVLIDGVKVSDPFQDAFDFGSLLADEGARIEVLRGEQSALYGSDAIGGVVNYISATGASKPGVQLRVEGGSFGTGLVSGRVAGVVGGLDYAITGQALHTDGFAVAPGGSRDVGADIDSLGAKLSYTVSPNLTLRAVGRFSDTRGDTDDQDTSTTGFAIDSDAFFRNRAVYGLVGADYVTLDGHWRNSVDLQLADTERKGYENGGQLQFGDVGQRYRGSYVSVLKFGTDRIQQTATVAFDAERDNFQDIDPSGFADTTKHHIDTWGLVGQYDVVIDKRLALGAAIRHDGNSMFKDDTTFHVQGSYRFDTGTRLHAAGGSGVKDPGVFELFGIFGGFVGNPDLKPEHSTGWEAGVEQALLNGHAKVDVTYFNSRLKDEITTDFSVFPSTPINLGTDSTRQGVETSATVDLGHGFSGAATYTYLDSEANHVPELRRAHNIASGNLDWRSADRRIGAHLTVRYNGEQVDEEFVNFTDVKLPSFTLVNLGADYRLTKTLQVYGRIENLTDEKYQEVFGYREAGRAAYAGVRLSF